jgi:hypothetical protein
MSGVTLLFMILVCGFVWGGFLTLLFRAVRSESGKRSASGSGGN